MQYNTKMNVSRSEKHTSLLHQGFVVPATANIRPYQDLRRLVRIDDGAGERTAAARFGGFRDTIRRN